jgi:starch synthase
MKGGIVYSNFVSTVSPKHAWEARHTDQGYGLGHVLYTHQGKFGGILNGIDYEVWNPEIDPLIPYHYTVDNYDMKALNTKALRDRLWLTTSEEKPIIAYVGRLDAQKGVHLVRHALFHAIGAGAQFILLGSSLEHDTADYFWSLKGFLNENPDCHLEIGFNEQLAHLIYAGADMVVVPSMFEPCGLTQMIAMRYGAVPIVRAVGGLSDTVFDWDYGCVPTEQRNGFVFDGTDHEAIDSAMRRALGLWYGRRDLFQSIAVSNMQQDWSWCNPGQHYLNIYEMIRHR